MSVITELFLTRMVLLATVIYIFSIVSTRLIGHMHLGDAASFFSSHEASHHGFWIARRSVLRRILWFRWEVPGRLQNPKKLGS